ncbi:MAG: V-type ATP synthase subunit F [Thermoplasmata archaeon]|nr:V-type ATP synthase subunit F [Thermoplasmata archaeon]
MELAVLGSETFVLGFQLVGIRKVHIIGDEDIELKLSDIMQDEEVGIVVIHNSSLQKLSEEARRKFLDSVSPVVVAVGTEEENDLREKVKRVIGIDLFKGG